MSPHLRPSKSLPWLRGCITRSPVSDARSSSSSVRLDPTSERSHGRETAFNCLMHVLTITKEVSSACPQLQLAVGTLLMVLEAYEKYSELTGAIETLSSRILPLNDMLRKVLSDGLDRCPQQLKERLNAFASKVQSIADNGRKLQSHGRVTRFLNAADWTEKIESWIKQLSWHIQSFILEGTIAVELTVHHGFENMEGRFNKVDEGLKGVNEGIQGVRSDIDNKLADDPIRRSLRPVIEARYDYGSSVHVPCLEDTRREVLATLCSWLWPDDPRLQTLPKPVVPAHSDRAMLWIYALAGVGKSTVARTIAEWWDEDKALGATFFAARDGERSNIACIFRTIAYQLACRFPNFYDALSEVVRTDADLYLSAPSVQLLKLIVEPLAVVTAQKALPPRIVIVIDALDECTDHAAISTVLKSLSLYISRLAPLKFLVTSRPEENITQGFLQHALDDNTERFNLHGVPEALITRDISTFLQRRLTDIGHRYLRGSFWPSHHQLDNLVDLSEHLFIFAATAELYIGEEGARDPEARLNALLDIGNAAAARRTTITSPFPILDALYSQVLVSAAKRLKPVLKAQLKLILGTIALAEERLSPTTLDSLLALSSGTVRRVAPALNALLVIPASDDASTPIRLIHLSFPNFLVDPARCTDKDFLVYPSIQHSLIALRCLELMQSLKYNICEVDSEHDHLLNSEIPDLPIKIGQHLAPALRYACSYWTRHLCGAEVGERLLSAFENFCNTHLLHWLEVLSLLGCVDMAIEALQSVQVLLKTLLVRTKDVSALLLDCERLVRGFYPAINASFMQVYRTAIAFSPLDSPVRRRYAADLPMSMAVRVGLERSWASTLTSTVTGTSCVTALAFSPDVLCLACGAEDGTIQILSVHTGAPRLTLRGHTARVSSVSFSPTGKEILSSSDDGTVKLWDVATEACLYTWSDHSRPVSSVAWSHDGLSVAFGDISGTLLLRKVAAPEKTAVLKHDRIHDVTFAQDGSLLSGSGDQSCKIWEPGTVDWDVPNVAPRLVLKHDSGVETVAVSPDSSLVSCGLQDGDVVLWMKSDGQRLCSLPGLTQVYRGGKCSVAGARVLSLSFQSKNRLATMHAFAFPCILWDISTVASRLKVFDNADDKSHAGAFSSDGDIIAHAVDHTVRISRWPTEGDQALGRRHATASTSLADRIKQRFCEKSVSKSASGFDTRVRAHAVSPTGQHIIALSGVGCANFELWDVSAGQIVRTNENSGWKYCISASGGLYAAAGLDHAVCVRETHTGKLIGTFIGHTATVNAIVFTRDEQHFLSASKDGTIRRARVRQTQPTASRSEVLFQSHRRGSEVDSLAVSSDGQWILSGLRERDPPQDMSSADLRVKHSTQPVAYGVQYLGDWYCSLRLHDATGRVIWIENHPSVVRSVSFSEDCTRAITGDDTGDIFLYDLDQIISTDKTAAAPPLSPLSVPVFRFNSTCTGKMHQVAFASDGRGVLSGWSYIPLSSEQQPLRRPASGTSLQSAYFFKDEWLWRINPDTDPQRICWLPLPYQPGQSPFERFWSVRRHTIVWETTEHSFVVLDATHC